MYIPQQLLLGIGIILLGYGIAFTALCINHEFNFKTYGGFMIFLIISIIMAVAGFLLIILSLLL